MFAHEIHCNNNKNVVMISNRIKKQAIFLSLFVIGMIGISYASVPLYKIFCQVTGYGGTPKVSEENKKESKKESNFKN